MAFKERTKSMNLRIYEILASRMRLDKEDYYYYLNLKKGYEGECRFDGLTEKLGVKCIILNDLQLEIRRSSLPKERRKAPCFSYGDIRRALSCVM